MATLAPLCPRTGAGSADPPLPARRPSSRVETYSTNGGAIDDFLHGVVFTDGTCQKPGPITWNRAGWAVLKLSEDGVVLAWARGPVGKLLPATPPASENVGVLGAATLTRRVDEARSDHKSLEGVELQPLEQVLSRKRMYSGIRRLIRGRAPPPSLASRTSPATLTPTTRRLPQRSTTRSATTLST